MRVLIADDQQLYAALYDAASAAPPVAAALRGKFIFRAADLLDTFGPAV